MPLSLYSTFPSYIPYSFHNPNPKYFSVKQNGSKWGIKKVAPAQTKQALVLWKQF